MGTPIAQEGTTSNRYTIIGRLASGGMAELFIAKSVSQSGVERYVVLKRVLAARSQDPQFITMFLDEARLASRLQHPNIAQVHDVGQLGGSHFYTMEYVHGEDVRQLLQRLSKAKRKLPVNLALYIAVSALAGLHHAHTRTSDDGRALGVVHRDVTPSNLMVSYEGAVKLLDFGVAKAAERSTESRAGTIKGKLAYLSPEQCQGDPVDRRSDIYSLGIVLYEMLTCRRLYKRDSDFKTMLAITQEPVPPPSSARPELSAELDRVVLKALAKDRNERYATAAEMIEDLEAIATAEHHTLSATAMSKLLRELFGERPPPWVKLVPREDTRWVKLVPREDTRSITVTNASVAGIDVHAPTDIGPPPALPEPITERNDVYELEELLDHAPVIERSDAAAGSGTLLPWDDGAELPRSGPVQAIAGPVQTIAVPAGEAPRRSRNALVAITTAVVAIGIAIAIALLAGRTSSRSAGRDAAELVVHAPVAAEPPAPHAPEPAPVAIDAAQLVAPPPSPPPSPSRPPPAPPPPSPRPHATPKLTIAEVMAKSDWSGVLALCSSHSSALTAQDLLACGTAACNTKQRATAVHYYQATSGPTQAAIEHACQTAGISLAAPAATHAQPHKDPCDDPTYADKNPLRCQK